MTFEMHDVGPPLTRARIAALEQELGVVFPERYRAFLIRYNGGRPKPHFFPIHGLDKGTFGSLHYFFGIDCAIRSNDVDWNCQNYDGRMPQDLFPIAGDGSGNIVCLSLGGLNKGFVYFWDHDSEHSRPSYDNVYLIADAFDKFLNSIYFEDISAEVAKSVGEAAKRPL